MEINDRFVRLPVVLKLTGLSAATIYRLENDGQFPARKRLGKNSVAWLESDVLEWMYTRESASGSHHE